MYSGRMCRFAPFLGSVSVLLLLSCSGVHSRGVDDGQLGGGGDHTLVWLDLELGSVLEDYQRTFLSLFSCIVPLVLYNITLSFIRKVCYG